MNRGHALLLALCLPAACALAQSDGSNSNLQALVSAERDFCKTSEEKGAREAFLAFLADDSILFRPGPVPGKKWQQERPPARGTLTWKPLYADVSRAGDFGYTTGPYEFRQKEGKDADVAHGNYFSVWRKQADAAWKVVIDLGTSNPPPSANAGQVERSKVRSMLPRAAPGGEAARAALIKADTDYSAMSESSGLVQAFTAYAAADIRLLRNGKQPMIGKQAARDHLAAEKSVATWQPLRADASRSADLGYTYGTAEYRGGPHGEKSASQRNYVRVWKVQPDGSWKIALDIETPALSGSPAN